MYDSLQIIANDKADQLAKRGAGLQPQNDLLYQNIRQLNLLAVQNARYIVRCLLHHLEMLPSEELERAPIESRAAPDAGSAQISKHVFKSNGNSYRCVCFALQIQAQV